MYRLLANESNKNVSSNSFNASYKIIIAKKIHIDSRSIFIDSEKKYFTNCWKIDLLTVVST